MADSQRCRKTGAYPEWLERAEQDLLDERRAKVNGASGGDPHVGLALSGGGIRSATFSLGILQALARNDVLRRVDYLSTVSGGGYIGSFLGGLYARGASVQQVNDTLTAFPESPQLRWLRNNGRYLAPNGAGASWLAGAVLLRNWMSLLLVLMPVAFGIGFLVAAAHAGVVELVSLAAGRAWIHLDFASGLRLHYLFGVHVSPLFVLPALTAAYALVPCGLAYWLVNAGHRDSLGQAASAVFVLLTLLGPIGLALYFSSPAVPFVSVLMGVMAAVYLAAGALRYLRDREVSKKLGLRPVRFNPVGPDRDAIARNKLSEWLKGSLIVVVLTLVVTALDSLGYAVLARLQKEGVDGLVETLVALGSGIGAVVLASHRVLALLGGTQKEGKTKIPIALLAAVAAIGLLVTGYLAVSAATHAIAASGGFVSLERALIGAGASLVFMGLLGHFIVFVNQSSLAQIYNARLTRTYLGASNPNRWQPTMDLKGHESPTEPIPGDQIPWDEYKPHASGGPIHLINVTVNETVDPRIQLHQPDRKGMTMAVGPTGISLGVRHHARWPHTEPGVSQNAPAWNDLRASSSERFEVFPTERLTDAEVLPVGHWVAISGAAVATGLGQLSVWGASLLCGALNLRLGYWWSSKVKPQNAHRAGPLSLGAHLMTWFGRATPIYRMLLAEFLGRFPGTAIPQWYLTDGGHMENTGIYELIRRRVPFIVCVDSGADPAAECTDLANIVRLARVDFGAEIEFLEDAELEQVLHPEVAPYFGSLQNLKRGGPAPSAYAGLARVRYAPDGEVGSWLLLIKPTLNGREPIDVSGYRLANASFPHQSTSDQSFDDAQWEAYRKLGDYIGEQLFKKERAANAAWSPRRLDGAGFEAMNGVPASGNASGQVAAAGQVA